MTSDLQQKNPSISKNALISLFCIVFFVVIPVSLSLYEVQKSRDERNIKISTDNLILSEGSNTIKQFANYGFDLSEIKRGHSEVPNIFLAQLPRELTSIKDNTLKKQLFISVMLPPILKVNEAIAFERQKLSDIMYGMETNGEFSTQDLIWLNQKMARYRMDKIDIPELYSRMNIIPPSLALTQAAIETGWGTSRFAQEANALYGQWTWDDEKGMIPLGREEGKTHSIKVFSDLLAAVEGYALNLNTHEAYKDFRIERNKFATPEDIEVSDLLITLIFYSELGFEYIDNLNSIIRINGLENFDQARLQNHPLQKIKSDQAP